MYTKLLLKMNTLHQQIKTDTSEPLKYAGNCIKTLSDNKPEFICVFSENVSAFACA